MKPNVTVVGMPSGVCRAVGRHQQVVPAAARRCVRVTTRQAACTRTCIPNMEPLAIAQYAMNDRLCPSNTHSLLQRGSDDPQSPHEAARRPAAVALSQRHLLLAKCSVGPWMAAVDPAARSTLAPPCCSIVLGGPPAARGRQPVTPARRATALSQQGMCSWLQVNTACIVQH
jgi:hypothetical protein